MRLVVVLALLLSACVLDEATPEDMADVESELATRPPVTTLSNGQLVTIASAAASSVRYYKLDVPAGYDYVNVWSDGDPFGSGMIYVRRDLLPSPTSYQCAGNIFQGCRIDMPAAGTYYVAVVAGDGYGFTNLTLGVGANNMFLPIANGYSEYHYNQYGFDRRYKLVVPNDVSTLSFTYTLDPADDGRLTMYVRLNGWASETTYACIGWIQGFDLRNTATCTFTAPAAGTYYVLLDGFGTKVVGTFGARYKFDMLPTPNGEAAN